MPQSDVCATSHKGLIFKVRNKNTPQSDVCATSHKGLISQLTNTIVWEHKLSQAWDKYKVSPSTGITINLDLPLELVHRSKFCHTDRYGYNVYTTDHGYDDLERIDSAEFVLNHSQRISVVTGTSSVYGVLEETPLTSTHPIQPSEARDHPRRRSRKALRRGGYNLA